LKKGTHIANPFGSHKADCEIIYSEAPQVVVMGNRMPEMGGVETMTAMFGRYHRIPVIQNTAYPQYRENFMPWGAEEYVIKASDFKELKVKIRQVSDKRKKI